MYLELSATHGLWYAVPSLAPGASFSPYVLDLRADVNCYNAGCTATVIADYGNLLTESSETNNRYTRRCEYHW